MKEECGHREKRCLPEFVRWVLWPRGYAPDGGEDQMLEQWPKGSIGDEDSRECRSR